MPLYISNLLVKDPEIVAANAAQAEADAKRFAAEIAKYKGLSEVELAEAKAKFGKWLSSPAGHSGLDMGDIVGDTEPAWCAWVSLTALIKNENREDN